jgi:hypothetical protein
LEPGPYHVHSSDWQGGWQRPHATSVCPSTVSLAEILASPFPSYRGPHVIITSASCSSPEAPKQVLKVTAKSSSSSLLSQSQASPTMQSSLTCGKTGAGSSSLGAPDRGAQCPKGRRLLSGNPVPNRWRPSRGGARAEVVLRRHLSQAGGKLLH